ncbi:hypothetical protein KPL70_025574 [Citrus sinensis]|nr:hypothetical protein KPL70_025574 [Citrus sinensis]
MEGEGSHHDRKNTRPHIRRVFIKEITQASKVLMLCFKVTSIIYSLRKIKEACNFSTFGAVLDMVTDRISTACLLVILSQVYREDFVTPGLVFVSLPVLDIGSQWLQMYRKVLLSLGKMPTTLYLCCSTFLTGKTSHKDAKDSKNWLFKAYYGNRMFMGYCCVACELLYLILFLIAEKQRESLVDVVATAVQQGSPLSFLVALTSAADMCVPYDIEKKQKP